MSGNGFRSVFMVASCAGAALGCYLVSLHVASERAALEEVETQIVLAERDIRLLQTEIGTRGRLAQLERWNVRVLALSAPSADQFLGGSFELARLVAPERKIDLEAPVVLATAPADAPALQVDGAPAQSEQRDRPAAAGKDLLHVASLKRELPSSDDEATPRKAETARPPAKAATKSAEAAAAKKPVDKPVAKASKPVTRAPRLAKADPLAPLPDSKRPAKDSRTQP